MTDHPMTWALAARMTIWTILALLAMTGLAVLIGKGLQKVGYSYPELTEAEDQDYEEGTQSPRSA